ncbi:MAG TPA: hypothetical protein VHU83_06305 [Bryobacteraceae bacterium]|jgi:hypothetical protein|nr:hypothetical protein [Bryobacteraceae bacterium]
MNENKRDVETSPQTQFAREVVRARQIWRRYPILILTCDEELPGWIRNELPPVGSEENTLNEAGLIEQGILTPVDSTALDDADGISTGAYQILRPLLSYEVIGDMDERQRAWGGYLPALFDLLTWQDTARVAVAAAIIHSAHDTNTPFEWFVSELLDDATFRSRTYDDVYRRLVDHADGNMRERWQELMRADKLIRADFPNGIQPITQSKARKETE